MNMVKNARKRRTKEEILEALRLKVAAIEFKIANGEDSENPMVRRLSGILKQLGRAEAALNRDRNGYFNAKANRLVTKPLSERIIDLRERLALMEARAATLDSAAADISANQELLKSLIARASAGEEVEIPDGIALNLYEQSAEDSGVVIATETTDSDN